MGVAEEAAGLKSLEFGAEFGDADHFCDGGGEGGGFNEVFEGALGVFDD